MTQTKKSLYDYKEKFYLYQCLLSLYTYCTKDEIIVINFIFNRTIFWSKDSEYIPYSHFLNGVHSKDKVILAKSGLSRMTLIKCLNSLMEKGFVDKLEDNDYKNAARYKINFKKSEDYMEKRERIGLSKDIRNERSKYIPQSAKDRPQRSKDIPLRGLNIDLNNIERNKIEIKEIELAETKVSADLNPQEKTFAKKKNKESCARSPEQILKSITKNREDKLSLLLRKEKPTAKDFEYVWITSVKSAYPDYPTEPFLVKHLGMTKKLLKNLPQIAEKPPLEFLKWSIENWNLVTKSKLKGLKSPAPTYPKLEFFISFKKEFIDVVCSEAYYREISRDDIYSKSYKRLLREGVSEEQAKIKAQEIYQDHLDNKTISIEKKKLIEDKKKFEAQKETSKQEIRDYAKSVSKSSSKSKASNVKVEKLMTEEEMLEDQKSLPTLENFEPKWD